MKRFLLVITAGILLMFSCTGNKTQSYEEPQTDSLADTIDTVVMDTLEQLLVETPTPKAMDELFDDFFFNFAANKKLQLTRIIFPLTVNKDGKKESIEKKSWSNERFFIRQGYYTLFFDNEEQMKLMKDTSINQAIVEKIQLKKNLVKDYVFNRIRGAWMLREINEMPIEDNVNASFLTFYKRFVSDRDFQVKSINKTVSFVGPDPDDDFNTMEGIITPDTWEAFAPQLPEKTVYNVIYGQIKPSDNEKIFIMRGIANGFELEMTFQRKEGKWKLTKLTT